MITLPIFIFPLNVMPTPPFIEQIKVSRPEDAQLEIFEHEDNAPLIPRHSPINTQTYPQKLWISCRCRETT